MLKEHTFGFSKYHGWGGDATIGVSQSFNDYLSWGVAAAYARNHNKFHAHFNHDLTTVTGSIFGSYHDCNAYVNLIASGSWLDFSRIHRHFNLGPVRETTHAHTNGEAFYGLINGGYNLYNDCCFSTGPIASIEYGSVKVDGYREKGPEVGNLQFRGQNGHSLISGLGWEANFQKECSPCNQSFCFLPSIADMGLNLSVSVNRQWLRNHRHIHFREITISGGYGALPYRMTRTTYVSGVTNFYAELCNEAVISAGYFFNVGSFDLAEHRITFGISMPLGSFF